MVCALKNQPSPFHHDLDAEEIEKFIKPPEDQEVLDLEVELEIEIPNYLFTEQEFEEEMNDNFPSCTSFEQADPVDTITNINTLEVDINCLLERQFQRNTTGLVVKRGELRGNCKAHVTQLVFNDTLKAAEAS